MNFMGFSGMFGDLVGFDEICSVRTGGKGVVSVNPLSTMYWLVPRYP